VSFLPAFRQNISNILLCRMFKPNIMHMWRIAHKHARFEFLTAAWPMIQFLWDGTLCRHDMTSQRTEFSKTNLKYNLHIDIISA